MDVELQVHNQERAEKKNPTSCNMDHLRGKWKWPVPQAHALSCVTFRFLSSNSMLIFPRLKGHVDVEVDVSIMINEQTELIQSIIIMRIHILYFTILPVFTHFFQWGKVGYSQEVLIQ